LKTILDRRCFLVGVVNVFELNDPLPAALRLGKLKTIFFWSSPGALDFFHRVDLASACFVPELAFVFLARKRFTKVHQAADLALLMFVGSHELFPHALRVLEGYAS